MRAQPLHRSPFASRSVTSSGVRAHRRPGRRIRLRPAPEVLAWATAIAHETGGSVRVLDDPAEAVAGAHAVYTDVFVSMGEEDVRDEKLGVLGRYQVDETLMARALPEAVFMHCLPAHRGEEVTAAVIDGPQSVVFDQAENRLHTAAAVLATLTAR